MTQKNLAMTQKNPWLFQKIPPKVTSVYHWKYGISMYFFYLGCWFSIIFHPRVTSRTQPWWCGYLRCPWNVCLLVTSRAADVWFFFAYRDYTGSILANMSNMFGLFQDMDSQGLNNKNNDDKLIGWNGVDGMTGMGFQVRLLPCGKKAKAWIEAVKVRGSLDLGVWFGGIPPFETIYWTKWIDIIYELPPKSFTSE